jgi:hypothetical protein
MPSIEIATIGLSTPLAPPVTSFAVVYEAGLRSHRTPSRFQADFDRISGSLYHLGNPSFSGTTGGAFFASELLSVRSQDADPRSFLEFSSDHVASVQALLEWLIDVSPTHRLLFTSDWQFGPEATRRFDVITLPELWDLHDSQELLLNALYPVAIRA